ncbi:E3 SUMO-protein ligase NSE2-like [Schistocerca gregaria]|uniref:E3 SUMO-protein ligase NSE2-like n=1 Tax=Schistocerca gregaria TaxID=7010 RepID=UPI00211F1CB9|nr:E3 SUMO-protein ligase NSE2-like [Schistocerca gregaria]
MAAYLKEFEEEWQTHKNRFMEYLITLSEPIPVYFQVSEKDEIVMTDAQINIIDPITMTVLENPVRNRLCNHVYSKKSIQSLLKKPKQLKCPVVGCPIRTTFTMDDLESDHELEEHINKIKSTGGKK